MSTTIDLTELGNALPSESQKILINIDDDEFDTTFLAHDNVQMLLVFTVHAQQYDMLPTDFCYMMGDYQLDGHETPQTLGLRPEDIIIASLLPRPGPAVDSFLSNVADIPAQDQDQEKENEDEDKEEETEDEEVDEPPFSPEEWPEQIRRIEEMVRAYDAARGIHKENSPHVNDQREDELGLPVGKKDGDVDMAD